MQLYILAVLTGAASAQLVNQATGSQRVVIDSVADLSEAAVKYKNCMSYEECLTYMG